MVPAQVTCPSYSATKSTDLQIWRCPRALPARITKTSGQTVSSASKTCPTLLLTADGHLQEHNEWLQDGALHQSSELADHESFTYRCIGGPGVVVLVYYIWVSLNHGNYTGVYGSPWESTGSFRASWILSRLFWFIYCSCYVLYLNKKSRIEHSKFVLYWGRKGFPLKKFVQMFLMVYLWSLNYQ